MVEGVHVFVNVVLIELTETIANVNVINEIRIDTYAYVRYLVLVLRSVLRTGGTDHQQSTQPKSQQTHTKRIRHHVSAALR